MKRRMSHVSCQIILNNKSGNTGGRKLFKHRVPGVLVRILFTQFGMKSVSDSRKTRNVRQNQFFWSFKNSILSNTPSASYVLCKGEFKSGVPKRSLPLIIDGLNRVNFFKKAYHCHLE